MESKKANPLSIIWNIISVVGTVLGFASFVDDFVTWKTVFNSLIQSYRDISLFPFESLSIKINPLFADYILIGTLCGGAFVKAISYAISNKYLTSAEYETGVKIMYFIMYLFFWPIGIFISLKQVIFKNEDFNELKIKTRFLQWLLASIILFVLILITNQLI